MPGPWRFDLHFADTTVEDLVARIFKVHGDGLVCYGFLADILVNRGFDRPLVAIGATCDPQIPQVAPDDEAIGRLGAEHLVDRGLETFTFLGRSDPWSVARYRGFAAGAAKAGYQVSPCSPDGGWPDWFTRIDPEYLDAFVRRLPPHVGVMCCQDRAANLLVDACERHNLAVPADVAVISVDNNGLFCNFARASVTSINLDHHIIGLRAAELLDDVMTRGPDACRGRRVIVSPHSIIERRSTDIPLHRDPDLSRAIHFMRRHAAEGISIDDVLEAVPMSRRSFEQRFLKARGHPPAEELRRLRLE